MYWSDVSGCSAAAVFCNCFSCDFLDEGAKWFFEKKTGNKLSKAIEKLCLELESLLIFILKTNVLF